MSGLDVFLSYSRTDRDSARRFADRLAEEGFSVWWDAALRAGETFDEVIETALKSARAVVVLWSPNSVASRWVRAEATLADRRNKLVPVIIEACDRPIAFELTHTTDLTSWNGALDDPAWRNLMSDLSQLVRRNLETAPEAKPVEAPAPSSAPAAAPPANGGNGGKPARHLPPRKLDNIIFAPIGKAPAQEHSNGADEMPDDDERTRIYTGSSPYSDDRLHCLELTIGERVEKRFIVSEPGLRIGRAAPSDVILADSRVSRAHCLVELADGELRVSDLRSTNGTFIDGERVDESVVLPVGSILKVGNVSLKHQLRTSADV